MNLIHTQGYGGRAAMTGTPHDPQWNADTAIDGNTSQDYQSNSCAITSVDLNKLTKSYWKVWLRPRLKPWLRLNPFNIAYLEIYFRSDSK